MEVLFVYLWLKLNALFWLIFLVFPFSLLCWGVYGMSLSDSRSAQEAKEFRTKWWSKLKRTLIIGISCLIISVMLPSTQQTAILVGTHYAVDLAKSPEGVKVFSLIRKKANDYLDEQLKPETKPQK